jgi:hypothetical protein
MQVAAAGPWQYANQQQAGWYHPQQPYAAYAQNMAAYYGALPYAYQPLPGPPMFQPPHAPQAGNSFNAFRAAGPQGPVPQPGWHDAGAAGAFGPATPEHSQGANAQLNHDNEAEVFSVLSRLKEYASR